MRNDNCSSAEVPVDLVRRARAARSSAQYIHTLGLMATILRPCLFKAKFVAND
jgi:hypothetical protein